MVTQLVDSRYLLLCMCMCNQTQEASLRGSPVLALLRICMYVCGPLAYLLQCNLIACKTTSCTHPLNLLCAQRTSPLRHTYLPSPAKQQQHLSIAILQHAASFIRLHTPYYAVQVNCYFVSFLSFFVLFASFFFNFLLLLIFIHKRVSLFPHFSCIFFSFFLCLIDFVGLLPFDEYTITFFIHLLQVCVIAPISSLRVYAGYFSVFLYVYSSDTHTFIYTREIGRSQLESNQYFIEFIFTSTYIFAQRHLYLHMCIWTYWAEVFHSELSCRRFLMQLEEFVVKRKYIKNKNITLMTVILLKNK